LNQRVKFRRLPSRAQRSLFPGLQGLELLLELRRVLDGLVALGAHGLEPDVPGELHEHQHDGDRDDVGGGAVHEQAALLRLMPLRDAFHVGGERVHQVVRLDRERSALHDFALDLLELVLVHPSLLSRLLEYRHGKRRARRTQSAARPGRVRLSRRARSSGRPEGSWCCQAILGEMTEVQRAKQP
jgi:hypothetical protein